MLGKLNDPDDIDTRCKVCRLNFSSKLEFDKHIQHSNNSSENDSEDNSGSDSEKTKKSKRKRKPRQNQRIPVTSDLQCPLCMRCYEYLFTMKAHFNRRHASRKIECKSCFNKYPKLDVYLSHSCLNKIKSKNNNNNLDSFLTQLEFTPTSNAHILSYKLSKPDAIPYQNGNHWCRICQKNFPSKAVLQAHCKRHYLETICKFCDSDFHSIRDLNIHKLSCERNKVQTPYTTDKKDFLSCLNLFSKKSFQEAIETADESIRNKKRRLDEQFENMEETVQTVEPMSLNSFSPKEASTPQAPSLLNSNSLLPETAATPLMLEPFVSTPVSPVPSTNDASISSAYSDAGSQGVQEERLFKCLVCKKDFTTKANCERHLNKVHLIDKSKIKDHVTFIIQSSLPKSTNGSPMVSCKYCNQVFESTKVLALHMRSLEGCPNKPFNCPKCRGGFTCRNNFIRHFKKLHPNEDMSILNSPNVLPTPAPVPPPPAALEVIVKEEIEEEIPVPIPSPPIPDIPIFPELPILTFAEPPQDEPLDLSKKSPEKSFLPKTALSSKEVRYFCPVCRKSFTIKSNMSRHIKKKHPSHERPARSRNFIPKLPPYPLPKPAPPTPVSTETKNALRTALFKKNTPTEIVSPVMNSISPITNNTNSSEELPSVKELIDTASSQNFHQLFSPAEEPEVITSPESKLDSSKINKRVASIKKEKKRNSYSDSPKKILCSFCMRKFPWKSSLNRHLLTHSGDKPYQCNYCSTKFTTKSNCERHMSNKHSAAINQKKLKNSLNQSILNGSAHTAEEEQTEFTNDDDKDSRIDCNHCSQNFSNKEELVTHITKLHSNLNFMCHICNMIFANSKFCLYHIQFHHPDEFEKLQNYENIPSINLGDQKPVPLDSTEFENHTIVCSICFESLKNKEYLKSHMKSHNEDVYHCNFCNMEFKSLPELTDHKNEQHGENLAIPGPSGQSAFQ